MTLDSRSISDNMDLEIVLSSCILAFCSDIMYLIIGNKIMSQCLKFENGFEN